MPEDASDWERASDYNYLDALGASDLAWEWLRRNDRYEDDFAAFDCAVHDGEDAEALIRTRWGLRFPATAVAAGARRPRLLAA